MSPLTFLCLQQAPAGGVAPVLQQRVTCIHGETPGGIVSIDQSRTQDQIGGAAVTGMRLTRDEPGGREAEDGGEHGRAQRDAPAETHLDLATPPPDWIDGPSPPPPACPSVEEKAREGEAEEGVAMGPEGARRGLTDTDAQGGGGRKMRRRARAVSAPNGHARFQK